jgi:hypothetical protein
MAIYRFEILDRDGNKVSEQEHAENFSPALLDGQTAHLTHVDGVLLSKKTQPTLGPTAVDPAPVELITTEEEKAEKARLKAERDAKKAETATDTH